MNKDQAFFEDVHLLVQPDITTKVVPTLTYATSPWKYDPTVLTRNRWTMLARLMQDSHTNFQLGEFLL